MNILIDRLPTMVNIGGIEYPIRTDYRYWVMLEQLLSDDGVERMDKVEQSLDLIFDSPINKHFLYDALEQISWFYRCGKEPKNRKEVVEEEEHYYEPIYSFEHDANYIYAAFMSQYGIDLQDAELHWWKFKALMQGLKEDNLFVKIMGYRSISITTDMPKGQREFYTKMKKVYALPLPQDEQEKNNAIEEALMGNGDISGLL